MDCPRAKCCGLVYSVGAIKSTPAPLSRENLHAVVAILSPTLESLSEKLSSLSHGGAESHFEIEFLSHIYVASEAFSRLLDFKLVMTRG